MLNIEKYKDEILREGGVSDFCVVGETISDCMNVACSKCAFYDCSDDECDIEKTNWLCEEYKEPEIDWDEDIDWFRVPVDTVVRVMNVKESIPYKRKFAVYVPGSCAPYETFKGGERQENSTSLVAWKYCKLANIEDIEKYRKR